MHRSLGSLVSSAFAPSLALALCGLASSPAFAQASFGEGFDGKSVADLEAAGWTFRNQSEDQGQLGWRPASVTDPYEGTHYLVTDGYCLDYGPGSPELGSNWAIFPLVAGQVAGDELSMFLAEGWSATRSDVLEVRYSPSGGTSTGSSATDLGDFTQLLASFEHDTLGWWDEHVVVLPGPGRIALRYWIPDGRSASMYVDSVAVGERPAGRVPLPAVGETVVWDLSISPVNLSAGTTNLLGGGTVLVDPGVEVVLQPGATLQVEGSLEFAAGTSLLAGAGAQLFVNNGGNVQFDGTAGAPIAVTASEIFWLPGMLIAAGSTLTMNHVQASVFTWVSSGATGVIANSDFTKASVAAADGPGFRLYNATLAIRSSSFTDGGIIEERGYVLLDDLTLTNSLARFYRVTSPQTLLLDNLVATDFVGGAPFEIQRFDVLFGANNVIQGNAYPVRLESGGLAPGSVLPTTGNANNFVSGRARIGSRSTWANVGLPYVLDWDNDLAPLSGNLTVEPGVEARFRRGENTSSDSFWIQAQAKLVARGTPDEPILFTHDGQGWGGLFFGDNSNKRPKLEHVIVEQADTAVTAKACRVHVESSLLRDNGTGAQSNSAGRLIARGTRFEGNGVGLETSPGAGGSSISAGRADLFGGTNPNTIQGNGQGVIVQNGSITVDARENYWGAASGPAHAANPGGQGDSATPNALVIPFRDTAPASDLAPLVRLERLADILDEGTKVILRWSVEDDGAIVSQRILHSPHGYNPALSVLVDDIAPDVRTLELTVPSYLPSSNLALPVLRVVAVDDQGQEGWDEAQFFTPNEDFDLTFSVDTPPATVRPGERHDICWGISYADAYLSLEDIDWAISLGGTTTNCLSGGMTVPGVSTDLARIIVAHTVGAGGRIRYEYSDYFSIRPAALIGDAPPLVQLDGPPLASYAGGSIVPLSWTASDDEALRSFSIQASYDGGRAWNVLVEDLPATTTSWAWKLPTSTGLPAVQVRVIATDLRFQTSSSTTTLDITPGSSRPHAKPHVNGRPPVRHP